MNFNRPPPPSGTPPNLGGELYNDFNVKGVCKKTSRLCVRQNSTARAHAVSKYTRYPRYVEEKTVIRGANILSHAEPMALESIKSCSH